MQRAEGAQLQDAWRIGQERWPGVRFEYPDFVAHVTKLHSDGSDPINAALGENAGDLFLAAACVAGNRAALSSLEQEFLSNIPRMVAPIDAAPAFGAEVAQTLRERLLCPPLERLKHYGGGTPLVAWLRLAARRAAIDLKRREGAARRRLNDLPTALMRVARGPDWELVRARYQAQLEKALGTAIDDLAPRDRMVLRLYLLRGENIDQIGKICGVHRATVARWIVAARRSILESVSARLGAELGLSPAELASLTRDLKSQLDITLERLL